VEAFRARQTITIDLHRFIAEAEALVVGTDSTWMRVQARALAAAVLATATVEPDLATMVDASPPPVDQTVLVRLEDLLASGESLRGRLAAHDAATSIGPQALRPAAQRLLQLFRRRAFEDLELPTDDALELTIATRPGDAWRAVLEPARLVLNGTASWTVDQLVRAISSQVNRHLARRMRPAVPEWTPSPETTVDWGLAAVGRETLLADHELAYELARIGRAVGVRWNGERIVAVGRARHDLAPAFAAAALGAASDDVRPGLVALGVDPQRAELLMAEWRDPLARAHILARAAGPPLVRAWLVTTGQTSGIQRLLSERLVPTMLRADMVDLAP